MKSFKDWKIRTKMIVLFGGISVISLAFIYIISMSTIGARGVSLVDKVQEGVNSLTGLSIEKMEEVAEENLVNTVKNVKQLISYTLETGTFDKDKLKNEILKIKIGKTGYVYILNSDSVMQIHPVPVLEGVNILQMNESEDHKGRFEYFKDIVKISLEEGQGFIEYSEMNEEAGETEPREAIAYFEYLKELDWIIASKVYKDELFEKTAVITERSKELETMAKDLLRRLMVSVNVILLPSAFGMVIIVILVVIFLSISLNRKTKKIITTLDDIYSDDVWDLNKTIDVTSKDEMGEVGKYFNNFLTSIKEIIVKIKDMTVKTKTISNDLSNISENSTESLDNMKATIEEIEIKIDDLDSQIHQANESSIEVKKFIKKVTELIDTQSSSIGESSASIEEMSAAIQNIATVSEDKLKAANELEVTAHSGEEEMQKTIQLIKKVTESANTIMDLINIINNIAGQTDLLAMNAAIEAAHAGESGRGFGVVADEIRKLAEDTTHNSKEITKSLKEVINYIRVSEESTFRTGKVITNMVGGIKEVADSMVEIKNSMTELSAGSKQVTEALVRVVNITEDVKNSSDEMKEQMTGITTSMNKTRIISEDVKTGMGEALKGIDLLSNSMLTVYKAGLSNNKSVSDLEEYLSKFNIEKDQNGKTKENTNNDVKKLTSTN